MAGLQFEDMYEGQTFTTPSRTVTEADVREFASVSGDFNPIHLDPVAASSHHFGQPIAHGILGVSIATGLIDQLGTFRESMVAMLGIGDWRFLAPIFMGDTVHLKMTIGGLRRTSSGDCAIVDRDIELVNQDDVIVQRGRITVMIRVDAG